MKNTIADGSALQAKGTAPGVPASGEADQYGAIRKIMKSIGCEVEDAEAKEFSGISVIPGPAIVLKPSFAVCPAEYKEKFTSPSQVKISKTSSLVVSGSGVVIESLDLDGALVINCEEGASGVIKDLTVKNKGWEKVADESNSNEIISMRGYTVVKHETHVVTVKKDGTIDGLTPKAPPQSKPAPPAAAPAAPTPAPAPAAPKPSAPAAPTPAPAPVPDPDKDDGDSVETDCGCIIQ